jgi:hypothetical protein
MAKELNGSHADETLYWSDIMVNLLLPFSSFKFKNLNKNMQTDLLTRQSWSLSKYRSRSSPSFHIHPHFNSIPHILSHPGPRERPTPHRTPRELAFIRGMRHQWMSREVRDMEMKNSRKELVSKGHAAKPTVRCQPLPLFEGLEVLYGMCKEGGISPELVPNIVRSNAQSYFSSTL